MLAASILPSPNLVTKTSTFTFCVLYFIPFLFVSIKFVKLIFFIIHHCITMLVSQFIACAASSCFVFVLFSIFITEHFSVLRFSEAGSQSNSVGGAGTIIFFGLSICVVFCW